MLRGLAVGCNLVRRPGKLVGVQWILERLVIARYRSRSVRTCSINSVCGDDALAVTVIFGAGNLEFQS